MISPAKRYTAVEDLAIVTSFFNPCGYRTKWQNFAQFQRSLVSSGLHLLVVEGAFGDEPFVLPPGESTLQIRCRDVMWQKERLINAALSSLPRRFTKIGWLDCDILFDNSDWAMETSALLDHVAIVQPFEHAIRLPPGTMQFTGSGTRYRGFCATHDDDASAFLGSDFVRHGHTGFAWAARRDIVERHGLYDACLAGSGDHLIAHAALGDWSSDCVRSTVGAGNPYATHFSRWAEGFYADVAGAIGFVRGTVLHLWHGEMRNRRYADRNKELVDYGFDPEMDLSIDAAGAWRWSSVRPALHEWASEYFDHRLEDGEAANAS